MFNTSQFTKEEKDACLPLIDELLQCAEIVQTEGILALESIAARKKGWFFKYGLLFLVDGTDPEFVEKFLKNLIGSENYSGVALLERILITEGLLLVYAGECPKIVKTHLLTLLGEDYLVQGFTS